MRRIGLFVLLSALAGCAQKPPPQPIDDPPALHPPDPVPVMLAEGAIPPPRPLLRDPSPELALRGRELFLKLQCVKCHAADGGKAPNLEGLYGATVELTGNATAVVDDWYLVESIRNPRAKVVAGWQPIMPAFDAEQLPAEELSAVVAYLRSLKRGGMKEDAPPPSGAPTARPPGK